MANPQWEIDGYTKIVNPVLEALCRYRLPGQEMQILLTILRKTYGYGKKEDWISLSQFQQTTGIHKPSIIRALKGLIDKKIVRQNAKGKALSYQFNKDFESWTPFRKKANVRQNANGVRQNAKKSSPKCDPQKKKEIIQKKVPPSYPPQGGLKEFNEFWSAYPKKKNKGQAEKAWVKIKPRPRIEIILSSIAKAKQSKDWQKDGGQFIPYPATWLNAKGWEDQYPDTEPQQMPKSANRDEGYERIDKSKVRDLIKEIGKE